MKSNIDKVYSKLPKTELATQKVELGVADDIAKMQSTLQKSMSDADDKLKEFKAAKVQFEKAKAEALKVKKSSDKIRNLITKSLVKANSLGDKTDKAANDLGVKSSDIKGYSKMIELISDLTNMAADIRDFDFVFTLSIAK
jgi:ATP-dependent protease HslVU (ClpYQ) ATPase subunit